MSLIVVVREGTDSDPAHSSFPLVQGPSDRVPLKDFKRGLAL
jgi:hypothetical protein